MVKTLSLETRKKISESMKLRVANGLGITPPSVETRKKLSELAKLRIGAKNPFFGKKHSEETKTKLSMIRKKWYETHESPTKGKKLSEEARKKLSLFHLGKPLSEETRRKIGLAHKGKKLPPRSEEHSRHISEAKKGCVSWCKGKTGVYSEESLKRMSDAQKKRFASNVVWDKGIKRPPFSEEWKAKMSKSAKVLWSDKEYKDLRIKASLRGLMKRPTSLEKQMIEIIKKNNLPYKYVGNGAFLIGFKNPDFVNVNGEKICIEVANLFHHQGDWAEKRIVHFKKYGWKCLVFFEKRKNLPLDEKDILEKMDVAKATTQ